MLPYKWTNNEIQLCPCPIFWYIPGAFDNMKWSATKKIAGNKLLEKSNNKLQWTGCSHYTNSKSRSQQESFLGPILFNISLFENTQAQVEIKDDQLYAEMPMHCTSNDIEPKLIYI